MEFLLAVFLLAIVGQGIGDDVTDGTRLISTFLIHRHGDRTPIEQSMALLGSARAAVEKASAPYGYGQLTDVGKRRAYKLGEFIRSRYDELLSPQYNMSEIYIRSTDSTRTKMTVLTAMSAVYSAYPGSWSDQINWVPTPYTTVPAKYDFNLANINCPTFLSAYYRLVIGRSSRLSPYSDVFDFFSDKIGFNVSGIAGLPYAIYDVFVAQEQLGVQLSYDIAAIMPRLKEAADISMDIIFGNDDYIALQAVLLNEFFVQASTLIEGVDTPRVRIYSAHDINVYSLMATAQISPRPGIPPYASVFALELRQVEATEQYVVLPVYQLSNGEPLQYIPVAGCDNLLCDFDQYRSIVSKYLLDETTWRSKCNFTEDIEIDDSTIA